MAASRNESLLDALKCAIYTKQADGTFDRCGRFAFCDLNDEHLRLVARKNYPFFVNNNQGKPLLICQAHQKCLQNGPKFNDQTYHINLAQYELDERREAQEFVNEFVQSQVEENAKGHSEVIEETFDHLFSDNYDNLHERYRDYREVYEDADGCSSSATDGQGNRKQSRYFDKLSATTLRRYKKFFKLPNRSGAASKQQLLDGMNEHFESVPVDSKEISANFLFTLHHKLNQLDAGGNTELNGLFK